MVKKLSEFIIKRLADHPQGDDFEAVEKLLMESLLVCSSKLVSSEEGGDQAGIDKILHEILLTYIYKFPNSTVKIHRNSNIYIKGLMVGFGYCCLHLLKEFGASRDDRQKFEKTVFPKDKSSSKEIRDVVVFEDW